MTSCRGYINIIFSLIAFQLDLSDFRKITEPCIILRGETQMPFAGLKGCDYLCSLCAVIVV